MASTCIVLACVPALFNWATWLLSDIFGEGGGVHVYAVNAAFGEEGSAIDGRILATGALLLSLIIVSLFCTAAEWSLRNWRTSILLPPALPALLGASFAAWGIQREQLPPPATSVLSLAVACVVFIVVGAYWFSLVAMRHLTRRPIAP